MDSASSTASNSTPPAAAEAEAANGGFLNSFNEYQRYPLNIIFRKDRIKLLHAYRKHHVQARAEVLRSHRFRAEAGVPVYDFGRTQGHDPWGVRICNTPEALRVFLGWPVPRNTPQRDGQAAAHLEAPAALPELRADTKCRFILLETINSVDRRLNVTEEMLFQILSYHQVSPCYLNFVNCLSPKTSVSDMRFGGFTSETFLDAQPPDRSVPGLGRSGLYFQLSLKLTACFYHQPQPTDRPGATKPWIRPQAAIYHWFDVKEAKALWILTSPRKSFAATGPRNLLWEQVREVIEPDDYARVRSEQASVRFSACLEVFFGMAEWCLSEYVFYLQYAAKSLEELTDPYIEEPVIDDAQEDESNLQLINYWMERMTSGIINLKDNSKVLQSLLKFYRDELPAKVQAITPTPAWLGECRGDLAVFEEKMEGIHAEITEILDRAKILMDSAKSRELCIQKLLQNKTNKRMKELTEANQYEARTMHVFQGITLVLLPVTVVSTVFNTDIAKFQNTDHWTGSWSWPAFLFWFIASVILTAAVFAWSAIWQRKSARDEKKRIWALMHPNLEMSDAMKQGAAPSGDGTNAGADPDPAGPPRGLRRRLTRMFTRHAEDEDVELQEMRNRRRFTFWSPSGRQ